MAPAGFRIRCGICVVSAALRDDHSGPRSQGGSLTRPSPTNPTAAWLSCKVTEAFPWHTAPRYLLREHDASSGSYFRNRVEAMGITEPAEGHHGTQVPTREEFGFRCLTRPASRWSALGCRWEASKRWRTRRKARRCRPNAREGPLYERGTARSGMRRRKTQTRGVKRGRDWF